MSKQQLVLSISVLVSNGRRDTIEKCMESLMPFKEALTCELILVDTGCTDGSIEIAEKYADKVIRFTWCNDFSAARNAGLKECSGEWFMFLDDDEWFEDVSELLSFFGGKEKEGFDAVQYLVRNYGNFEGTSYTDTYAGRVVKRLPETRFCGRIHEWIEPIAKRIKRVQDYVHHYGYVFKNEEERQKHAIRNISLVEAVVKENPNDIRMCCQLVQAYRIAKRYEDAIGTCKEALERTKLSKDNAFVQYLLLALPRVYREQGDFEHALSVMNCIEQEEPLSRQAKMVLYHERAAVYVYLKREEELQQECKKYLNEYNRLMEEGEKTENLIMDFASFSSPFVRQMVVRYGIMSVLRSGNYDYAEVFFDAVEWNKDREELVIALVQCYIDSGNNMLLLRFLPRVLVTEGLKEIAYGTFDSMYEKYPEKRKKIAMDLELFTLASQLKDTVRVYLEEGRAEDAMKIVSELATMIPEDEEISEWLKW